MADPPITHIFSTHMNLAREHPGYVPRKVVASMSCAALQRTVNWAAAVKVHPARSRVLDQPRHRKPLRDCLGCNLHAVAVFVVRAPQPSPLAPHALDQLPPKRHLAHRHAAPMAHDELAEWQMVATCQRRKDKLPFQLGREHCIGVARRLWHHKRLHELLIFLMHAFHDSCNGSGGQAAVADTIAVGGLARSHVRRVRYVDAVACRCSCAQSRAPAACWRRCCLQDLGRRACGAHRLKTAHAPWCTVGDA
eukprot:366337-Chlamydomonas_euryale.AAC.17